MREYNRRRKAEDRGQMTEDGMKLTGIVVLSIIRRGLPVLGQYNVFICQIIKGKGEF